MQHNSDRRRRSLFAFSVVIAVAVLAAVLLRAVALEVYLVPSGSMRPTLQPGDRVIIEKLSRLWRPPARGDVVAFDGTDVWDAAANGQLLAKRVIGVAGDHVVCCDAQGQVRVNGTALSEPYARGRGRSFDVVVPEGRLWLLGDDRAHSQDSAYYRQTAAGGSVPVSRVFGRVVAVVWPRAHAGILGLP